MSGEQRNVHRLKTLRVTERPSAISIFLVCEAIYPKETRAFGITERQIVYCSCRTLYPEEPLILSMVPEESYVAGGWLYRASTRCSWGRWRSRILS